MDELIEEFHRMWDGFPGMARLISVDHKILAANEAARAKGFAEGQVCAQVGAPQSHKGCLMQKMLDTGEGQVDMPDVAKARGWLPVQGHEDVFVHFTLPLPVEAE